MPKEERITPERGQGIKKRIDDPQEPITDDLFGESVIDFSLLFTDSPNVYLDRTLINKLNIQIHFSQNP